MLKRFLRYVFSFTLAGVLFASPVEVSASVLPDADPHNLPKWRGFNLLNLFNTLHPTRFREHHFELISEWGFNFVRLPMDYRTWILRGGEWYANFFDIAERFLAGDKSDINMATLEIIDEAIEFGQRHGIHVQLNFHRAPGYTVAAGAEPTSLWEDELTQRFFAAMWGMFSERYSHIPNRYLSFNLVNEPPYHAGDDIYAPVMEMAARAIWEHKPDRLIIVDGLYDCSQPSERLRDYGIGMGMAFRGYRPWGISHHQAEWMWTLPAYSPTPVWPGIDINNVLLTEGRMPVWPVFDIVFDFNEDYVLYIDVHQVSNIARLAVTADGVEVFYHNFDASDHDSEDWDEIRFSEQHRIYQNILNKDYRAIIPGGTSRVQVKLTSGDWVVINNLRFYSENHSFQVTPNFTWWGKPITDTPIVLDQDGRISHEKAMDFLRETIRPFTEFDGGIMVGEWGVHNRTPHHVALAFMRDMLSLYEEYNIGWALWNFTGSFGIINSGRTDVEYEVLPNGYLLDRQMLRLLQGEDIEIIVPEPEPEPVIAEAEPEPEVIYEPEEEPVVYEEEPIESPTPIILQTPPQNRFAAIAIIITAALGIVAGLLFVLKRRKK